MTRLAVVLLCLALLAAPLAVEAQQPGKAPRVAIILGGPPLSALIGQEPSDPLMRGFLEGLREQGYVDGQNIIIDRRSAEGRLELVDELVASVMRSQADVIVTSTNTATRAAQRATTMIPIVMVASSAPVEGGLVASLARPGGNTTGLDLRPDVGIYGKQLELLASAVPGLRRVAVLRDIE